ncbi:MAG: hypothetical protein ABOK23_11105 [Candidatus Methanoperedens sp.]|nr:hypothetical protein [Candidatus Methanoperedens sp.]MCZ7395093.1 hypothetical protein [Candidatus Methanoperedens sp.]
MKTVEKITIDGSIIKKVNLAIEAELAYEAQTHGKRKLGITGEVGEILVCGRLGLQLVLDSRSEGYDAIDKDGLKVQIKTRRSESQELPRNSGRTGRFSKHPFDYALLVLLDPAYQLHEVWRADYAKLNPKIEKQERRDLSISYFKRVGRKIYPLQ